MLAPVRVTGPAEPPVSVTEAKAHLRIDHDDDDLYIGALIDAAAAHLDGYDGILRRALVTQTWRQDFPCFPVDGKIRLPLAPVLSVESVTYLDPNGAGQTLDPASYIGPLVDGLGPYVRLTDGQAPSALAHRDDAVSVAFTAGYGGPDDVPPAIRHAILLLVGQWYAVREPVNIGNITSTLDFSVPALLAPYRRISF